MQDVTGDLMAGVVLGLSQMTCTPVLEVIDGARLVNNVGSVTEHGPD
jgi:hypothetical protein